MCFYESEQKVDSYLATDCDGPVEDAMHAQNSRLWRVDNRCTEHGSEHAAVADGEGSSVHVFHSQFILTGLQTHHRVKCECYICKSVTSIRKDKIIIKKIVLAIKRQKKLQSITFSPSKLMAFSISAKFMPSTFRMTGTTRPCEKSHTTESAFHF